MNASELKTLYLMFFKVWDQNVSKF